jgi:hypothetical protein
MSSPWSDNIFTSLVSKVSSKMMKKKAVAAASNLSSSSVIGDQQFAVSGSVAAVGVQRQVQQQQQHQQLFPCQRSPVPASTPIAMSSSSAQAADSHPNSRAGAEVPQIGSLLAGPGISRSGSTLSLTGLSRAGSSVTGAAPPQSGSLASREETSHFGSSSSATLPKMTSSLFQSADSRCPNASRFSIADESEVNNNDGDYHGTVVTETLPHGIEFDSHLNDNNKDSSEVDESDDNNNDDDADETQLHNDFVQELNPMH